jgi:hypothetical protein
MFRAMGYFQRLSCEVNVKQVYTEPTWTKNKPQQQLLAEILYTKFHQTPFKSFGVGTDIWLDINSPLRYHFTELVQRSHNATA